MKVKDLIKKLKEFDPSEEVILDGDDDGWFEIDTVATHIWENACTGELKQFVNIERVY